MTEKSAVVKLHHEMINPTKTEDSLIKEHNFFSTER